MKPDYFISIATNINNDTPYARKELVEIFQKIQDNVECAHEIYDSFYMADHILRNQNCPGPLVEFGCFKGGMSAKLSHVAYMLNKKYIIFDCFQGLPYDATYQSYDPDAKHLGQFSANQFTGTFDEVYNNIKNYGKLVVCKFIKGYIENTLPKNMVEPCHAFIDVDLKETAKFILHYIWDRTTSYGIFTHESCLVDYVDSVTDKNFWKQVRHMCRHQAFYKFNNIFLFC
jgi:O-methyltransferase